MLAFIEVIYHMNMLKKSGLPLEVYAIALVRLVVSAGSFVGPFLAMMLTIKLGYNEARAGLFVSLVSVLSAAGLLGGGKLGDSFGRPQVLRSLQALSGLFMILCAIIGFTALTPFIIAMAMGTLSGTWPVINAIVADIAPPDRRKEAFSIVYWANNIGFSLGPLVAGFLFYNAPRMLFVGNGLALLIAATVVSFFVKGKPYNIDDALTVADTQAIAATASPEAREADPQCGQKTGTVAVFLANPLLLLYALVSIITAFIYSQHTFALPIFLKDILGPEAGPRAFGMAMSANGLTVVILTIPVTFMARRLSHLGAIALSAVFYAIGFGSYWFALAVPLILGSTVIWTVGEILGATNGNAFVAEHAPPAHRSRINSAVSISHIISSTLAPIVAGGVASAWGIKFIWPVTAALSIIATVAYFLLRAFEKRGLRANAC